MNIYMIFGLLGVGGVNDDRTGNDAVMKSTASGGSPDGSMEATSVAVAQDNGADDRAATTIQAMYRGFRARKYVEAVNAAAVKIQAGFRGYRVRQSLKNASPSTATTTTDDSQGWSDDDQKSIVSVTYVPLKEYRCESRGVGDGDDGSDDGGHGPSAGNGVVGVGSIDGKDRSGDIGVGGDVVGGVVSGDVAVSGVDIYVDDDDDDDQLQTGDDEVFESDDVGPPAENPTITLSEPTSPATPEDPAEVEALVQAAVKIQARVRGFAVRKRLNEEKKDIDDKQ